MAQDGSQVCYGLGLLCDPCCQCFTLPGSHHCQDPSWTLQWWGDVWFKSKLSKAQIMSSASEDYSKQKRTETDRDGQRRWFVICNDDFCDWRPGLLYAACCMVSIVWGQNLSRKLSLHLPFLSSLCYAIRRRFSLRSILRNNYNAINRLYYPISNWISLSLMWGLRQVRISRSHPPKASDTYGTM
jgi:hypothetical protein